MFITRKIILSACCVLLLSGCYTPKPARDASNLLSTQIARYKASADTFVERANIHRSESASRISADEAWNAEVDRNLKELETKWDIADDKKPKSMLKILRAYSAKLIADHEASLTFRSSREKELKKRFGKIEFSTKKIDEIVKTYANYAKQDEISLDGISLDAESLKPLLDLLGTARRLDGTLAGDILDKVIDEKKNEDKDGSS